MGEASLQLSKCCYPAGMWEGRGGRQQPGQQWWVKGQWLMGRVVRGKGPLLCFLFSSSSVILIG